MSKKQKQQLWNFLMTTCSDYFLNELHITKYTLVMVKWVSHTSFQCCIRLEIKIQITNNQKHKFIDFLTVKPK